MESEKQRNDLLKVIEPGNGKARLPPSRELITSKGRTQGTKQSCVSQGRISALIKTCFVN